MAAMEKNNKTLNVPHLRFPEFSGEWEIARLGDVCKFFSGGTPSSTNKDFYDGDIPFIRSGEIHSNSTELYITEAGLNSSSAKIVEQGDLLLALYGATSGDIAISKIKGAINQAVLCIRTNHDNLFLKSCWEKHCEKLLQTYLQGGQGNLSAEIVKSIKMSFPSYLEQKKISGLLSLIEERISTQRKIIEDLKKLKDAITHSHFRNVQLHCHMRPIGQCLTQVSKKNKDAKIDRVLSVSNKYGFINQDEQFEDREVASADTSNYKVVHKGDFAYNPARINVGSVARLQEFENGIVSPMYVCFTAKKGLLPAYFELYLSTSIFKHEMNKRLEGSVRLCLTYESLCNIKIALPEFNVQKDFVSKVCTILTKIKAEEKLLYLYLNCKLYLLTQMFI